MLLTNPDRAVILYCPNSFWGNKDKGDSRKMDCKELEKLLFLINKFED
jgi:hypothetical protein